MRTKSDKNYSYILITYHISYCYFLQMYAIIFLLQTQK